MYDTFKLLKKLCDQQSPAGHEENIRETISELVASMAVSMETDVMGNLLVYMGSGEDCRLLVATHMDENGIIATYCDPQGYFRFSRIGGIPPYTALHQKVVFTNGVTGVIQKDGDKKLAELTFDNLYVDIGASSDKEGLKKLPIGTAGSFVSPLERIGSRKCAGKALDNRSGCAVSILAMQMLAEAGAKLKEKVCFAFTVQEEIGCRGAKILAEQLRPAAALAVDVTIAGDEPNCGKNSVVLGKGPAVKIMDGSIIAHPEIRKMLEDVAEENDIKVQHEIITAGGTDAGAIQPTAGGIKAGGIAIPCRYIHTTNEEVAMSDVEGAATLLTKAIEKMCN